MSETVTRQSIGRRLFTPVRWVRRTWRGFSNHMDMQRATVVSYEPSRWGAVWLLLAMVCAFGISGINLMQDGFSVGSSEAYDPVQSTVTIVVTVVGLWVGWKLYDMADLDTLIFGIVAVTAVITLLAKILEMT